MGFLFVQVIHVLLPRFELAVTVRTSHLIVAPVIKAIFFIKRHLRLLFVV